MAALLKTVLRLVVVFVCRILYSYLIKQLKKNKKNIKFQ